MLNRRSLFRFLAAALSSKAVPAIAKLVEPEAPYEHITFLQITEDITREELARRYPPIQVNIESTQEFEFNDAELQLSIEDFRERYLVPSLEANQRQWKEEDILYLERYLIGADEPLSFKL